eukprot:gene25411-biopygen20984
MWSPVTGRRRCADRELRWSRHGSDENPSVRTVSCSWDRPSQCSRAPKQQTGGALIRVGRTGLASRAGTSTGSAALVDKHRKKCVLFWKAYGLHGTSVS